MDEIVVIAAGPAALSTAITLANKSKEVVVIDEYLETGGRLLGQLYQEPNGNWWNGIKESKKLYDKAIHLGVDIHLNESVYDIEKIEDNWHVYTDLDNY